LGLLVGAREDGVEQTLMERVEEVEAVNAVDAVDVDDAVDAVHGLEKMAAEAAAAPGLVASVDYKQATESSATRFCRLGFLVSETVVHHKNAAHDQDRRGACSSSCSADYRLDDEAAADAADKILLDQVVPHSLWLAKAPHRVLEAALSALAAWVHSLDIRILRAHSSCNAALLHRTSSFGPCTYGIRSWCGC
jgi:hypothetical protein